MISTMVVYNSILLISTFLIWLSSKYKSTHKQNFCLCVSFLIVFIPAAIRYYIAEDYFGYVSIFDRVLNEEPLHLEPGFYLIIKVIQFFNGDVQWLFVISSFLIYFFLFKSYNKNKYSWVVHFAFVLLFYLETYSVIRASLAITIVMYATNSYVNNKNIFKLVFTVFLASLFHKSALLVLLVFLCANDRFIDCFNRFKLNYLVLIFLFSVFFYKFQIVNFIMSSGVVEALGYDVYLGSDLYLEELKLNTGLGFILKFLFLVLPLFFYDYIDIDKRAKFYYAVFIYFCAITLVLSMVFFIFKRVNYIYYAGYFYSALLLYNVRFYIFSKISFISFIVFNLYIFENFILINMSDKCAGTRISPYVTIFNKKDDKSIKVLYEECIALYGEDANL